MRGTEEPASTWRADECVSTNPSLELAFQRTVRARFRASTLVRREYEPDRKRPLRAG
jgi:hypothetical protein